MIHLNNYICTGWVVTPSPSNMLDRIMSNMKCRQSVQDSKLYLYKSISHYKSKTSGTILVQQIYWCMLLVQQQGFYAKSSYNTHLRGICTTSRPQVEDWRQYVSGSNVGFVTVCDTYKSASPNLPTWENEKHYCIKCTVGHTLPFSSQELNLKEQNDKRTKLVHHKM
jgi:hypothetical protein